MTRVYNLPAETSRLVQTFVKERTDICQNLALILDRYPPDYVLGNNQGKSKWLKELAPNSRIDLALTEAIYHRWLAMMSAFRVTSFNAILDWRMVIGLGGGTVLETDLTLHHLYGIPYIPGSALKGLTRAYATSEEKEGHLSPKIEEDDEMIQEIFGLQKHAGSVIFFDAMPINGKFVFDLDIMNAHYPDYYGQNKLPTNDQNPNPITFLTVARTTFMFALAPRHQEDEKDIAQVAQAKKWLKRALEKYGIGGKTSAGYGYFTDIRDEEADEVQIEATQTATVPASPPVPHVDPQARTAEGYKREIDALRDVAGQIHGYYQRWKQLTSSEAQLIVAKAIVEKVRQAGREKASADRPWYKELVAFLAEYS